MTTHPLSVGEGSYLQLPSPSSWAAVGTQSPLLRSMPARSRKTACLISASHTLTACAMRVHASATRGWCGLVEYEVFVCMYKYCCRLPCSGSTLQRLHRRCSNSPSLSRPRVRVARTGAPVRRSSAMYGRFPRCCAASQGDIGSCQWPLPSTHTPHHSGVAGSRTAWSEGGRVINCPPRKTICASHPLRCCGTYTGLSWGWCRLQVLRASGAGRGQYDDRAVVSVLAG